MALRPEKRPAGTEIDPLARLIAAWPGPAAVLAGDGTVTQANPAAADLLAELTARAGHDGLSAFVGAAHSDGQARSDTIVIPGHPGVLTYDVSIVPLDDGALLLARDVSLAANLRQALAESRQ